MKQGFVGLNEIKIKRINENGQFTDKILVEGSSESEERDWDWTENQIYEREKEGQKEAETGLGFQGRKIRSIL